MEGRRKHSEKNENQKMGKKVRQKRKDGRTVGNEDRK